MVPSSLLTLEQVSDELNLSSGFIAKLVKDGKLVPVQENVEGLLFSREAVMSFRKRLRVSREQVSVAAVEYAQEHGLYDDEFTVIKREA